MKDTAHPQSRRRGCFIHSLQILLGLILTATVALYAVYYFSSLQQRSLTTNLPDADRIEVESLDVTKHVVIATREIAAPQTRELEQLWHTQSYLYWGGIMCHDPIYRLRFYQKDLLLTEATICFHCHNIYFYKYSGAKSPDDFTQVNFGISFDLKNAASSMKRLHTFLDNLFPNPKDRPVYPSRFDDKK